MSKTINDYKNKEETELNFFNCFKKQTVRQRLEKSKTSLSDFCDKLNK